MSATATATARAARHTAAADAIDRTEAAYGIAGGGGIPHRQAAAAWAIGDTAAAIRTEAWHGIAATGDGPADSPFSPTRIAARAARAARRAAIRRTSR